MSGELFLPMTSVSTEGISSGYYLLKINAGEAMLTKKIVIQ